MKAKEAISSEDFIKVVKWYNYSQNFKKLIKHDITDSIDREYYFVDSDWINNFKKVFHYDKIKQLLPNQNDKEIIKIYNNCRSNFFVNESDLKQISINKNNNIIQKQFLFDNKYLFNYFYTNFILLTHDIYEDLRKGYTFMNPLKFNVCIGSGFFIIKLNKSDIEIGVFESVYQYKDIFLFKFLDENEVDNEIKEIKYKGIYKYISDYKIEVRNLIVNKIRNNNGKEIIIINLSNYCMNKDTKTDNDINYRNKKETIAYKSINFSTYNGGKNSQLNSVAQLLSSIKEIRDYLFEVNYSTITENKHIYILSFMFINIINQLYGKNKNKNDDNFKKLEYIINFMTFNSNFKTISDCLYFILNTLHQELNLSENNKIHIINLISLESPLNYENETLKEFTRYYKENYNSIISNNFNWIRKQTCICQNCNKYMCKFQSFPALGFNLDEIHDYTIKQQTEYQSIKYQFSGDQYLLNQKIQEYIQKKQNVPIDITDCFNYYLKKEYPNKIGCCFCNKGLCKDKNSFYQTPYYFIFILFRGQGTYPKSINIKEELNLETYLDNTNIHKKYKLMGLINNLRNKEENNFYSIIRNSNQKWILFKDSNISEIEDIKKILSSEDSTKKSSILLYKALKYN